MIRNLRTLSVNIIDNTLIRVLFTDNLSSEINIENITITSQTPGVPSPLALETRVINNILEIKSQPLTAFATYYIIFNSTDTVSFRSLNGNALLLEDGVANKQLLIGPLENTNIIKEYFINYLTNNVYNIEGGSILNDYLTVLSNIMSELLNNIRQARNDNYLTVTITDELKTRGVAGFDRLDQEGVYEILRVGRTPTGARSSMTLSIDEFTGDAITLLKANTTEVLTSNSIDRVGIFNINNFILNLSNRFVTKLTSVIFTYSNGHLPYTYDIETYGYQILDPKYDTDVAFAYLPLEDNQIRLSDKILEDADFATNNIFQITTLYEYKDTSRVIDQSQLVVQSVANSGREVLPPLRNVFNLKHAPIVTSNNSIGSIGDIQFVDQNSLAVLQAVHTSFETELPFRLDFLPSTPGQYSVDYETGTVYVYGEDTNNDGTGATPPLAIYQYRVNYKENIDWIIESDNNDLAPITTGALINEAADIIFNYESVLAKGIDYKNNIHQEILDERIGNNIVALNALTVENSPITNVFRIFNETTGEIYKVFRWINNKIYFTYTTPPNIEETLNERVSFDFINNEVMTVNNVFDASPVQIFYIQLNNNNIMAQSEDSIGASFNSTISFSNNDIFARELYFNDLQTEDENLTRLTIVGDYFIDYTNGIVYVTVEDGQDTDIGTISYKRGYIVPTNPHLTSVQDLYYRINTMAAKDKVFEYLEFEDGLILPALLDKADEQVYNNDSDATYVMLDGEVGVFIDEEFVNSVTDNIQFIRGIYEIEDLLYNYSPLNFSANATFSNKSITADPLTYTEYHSVEYDGSDYFITLNTELQYLSSNITLDISIIRMVDDQQLWDETGVVVLGNLVTLTLPGIGTPVVGDSVIVNYSYTINDLSHIIVDYNKGEYYIDYSSLLDEIIVSYEYGDNSLDFRESDALNKGDTYYATYKVGALRDALLKNFGSLIDIDILNSFDITFGREQYRDAITAAMHSFAKGPTIAAIKNIASTISHMPAEIRESVFESWSLGYSLLTPHQFDTTGDLTTTSMHYGNGILLNQADQSITIPAPFNIRFEEGTFEAWVKPEWDGLDNLAELRITPFKDGYTMSELEIFIGALEYHPELETDNLGTFFTVDKNQRVEGTPNRNKDGIYVYYDDDITGSFKRWFIEVIDGYANDGYGHDNLLDGYVSKNYSINIKTNGRFYDLKSMSVTQPSTSRITSGTNNATFTVTSIFPNEGITFVADIPHYILDVAGTNANKNRLSLFKDESGYIVLKVYDNLLTSYMVSTDVSDWKHGDLHHVAASWKINTKIGRDELHLFIDGFEVPNILKYGDKIRPYLHEKFRTVNPEEIVGMIDRNIISSDDLSTIISSAQVTSSLNFGTYGIEIGDTIYIEESSFDTSGYTITNVNGNTLTLSSTMPATITDGTFVINKTDLNVTTEVDIYPNFTVSLIHSYFDATDLTVVNGSATVTSSSTNFIVAEVEVGDLIRINDDDFEKHYIILDVTTNTLLLNDDMPESGSNLSFNLYHNEEEEIPGVRASHPAYELSKSDDGLFTNILTIRNEAQIDDLVMIRTLGLNHRRVRRKYYVWSDTQSILKTKLPSPISLNEANIYKIILPSTFIGPSNATLGLGIFDSDNISVDALSNDTDGRILSVSIKGDNIDFATSTTVEITGTKINGAGVTSSVVETLTFDEPGVQDTSNLFVTIDHINVHCKPINSLRNCAVIEIREMSSLIVVDNTDLLTNDPDSIHQATIRYSYQVGMGNTLVGDGYEVTDDNEFFSSNLVNNYLVITSPLDAVGYYKIASVSDDHHTMTLSIEDSYPAPPLSSFTDGYYEILNTTDYRSGLQNGYFTFEYVNEPGSPYLLTSGWYELDYYTYLQIPFDPTNTNIFIGSDFNTEHQLYGSIDEVQILNIKLTDTRVGETAPSSQRTITKEFNAVKPPDVDVNTLVSANFDTLPPRNVADVYRYADHNIIQAGTVINDNFTQSIVFIDKSLKIDNEGILNTKKEGTIEFWVNPLFDANNDPNYRFYFDGYGATTEEVVSTNNSTIILTGTAAQIISVKLKIEGQTIDYFAGGELDDDKQTLHLHTILPNQNSIVLVTYLPYGLKGDRISIYKDISGYINFNIRANSIDYNIRTPVFWSRNTWHRVKASYTFNSGRQADKMHLFVDGYEHGNVLFGDELLFGEGLVFGSSFSGPNAITHNIKFTDTINHLTVGGDYAGHNRAHCLMDNFRISNIARPIYQPFGEPLDPNYSSNLDMVYPITEDLYTTLLLNFNTLITKNTDFIILNSKLAGLDDFEVTVYDAFGIINDNLKVKHVLEALIHNFKPATSRAFILYK